MSDLEIERIGGLAGFGGAGGRLKSVGRMALSDITHADQQAVDALFDSPPQPAAMPDAFRYKITRETPEGAQTVEVPEQAVPQALIAAVRDELL